MRREAERLEEDAIYSSKSHFNAETARVNCYYWLGIPVSIIAAIAGAAFVKNHPESGAVAEYLISQFQRRWQCVEGHFCSWHANQEQKMADKSYYHLGRSQIRR